MSEGQLEGDGGMGKLLMRSQLSLGDFCACSAMKVGRLSEKETFFWMRSGAGFMIAEDTEDVFRL